MKYLKRINEVIKTDVFKLTDEDIEDICLEMIDSGFTVRISKIWMSDGIRSKEPLKSKSIPVYEIELDKPEEKYSNDKNRWNGSLFLDESPTLRMFMSILRRFESYGKTYYYIRNCQYHISLHLNEVETETGFDFSIFNKELGSWFDTLEHNYNNLEDNLFYLNRQFKYSQGFSGSNQCIYGITTKINKEEIIDILVESDKDSDNKGTYNDFIKLFNKKIDKYSKFIDINIEYNLINEFRFTKKTGVFRKKELIYSLYEINFKIKQK